MVRKQLDDNDLCHYYGNFFESTILKLPDHSHIQNSFAPIMRHFENGIEMPYSVKFYGHGSS